MKKFALILFTVLAVSSCKRVPITGRKQLNILPESTVMEMSLTSYRDFLNQHKVLPDSDPNTQLVKRVGNNIAQAVQTYFKQKNQLDQIKGYNWEFNVVEDKVVNAWCMPGGKVVVYTGILPITQTEPALATVMGHEIAHAIARHGNERMSQGLAAQLGGVALDVALSQKPQQTRDLFLTSYGVGSTLGILKYSRTHESEADKLGLVFMALAGYDPNEAVGFWQRMAQQSKGQAPPEFMSTHPSDETRIKDIRAYIPTAMKYYKKPGM